MTSTLALVVVTIYQLATFFLCEVLLQLRIMELEKTQKVDLASIRKLFYRKIFSSYFLVCFFEGFTGLPLMCLPLLVVATEVLFTFRKLHGWSKKESFAFLPYECSKAHFYLIIVLVWLVFFGTQYAITELLPFQHSMKNFG